VERLFPDLPVRDRGISGDTTAGVLAQLDTITASRPAAVFLLVGTNELARRSIRRRASPPARDRGAHPSRVAGHAGLRADLLPRAVAYRERVESYNAALRENRQEAGATWIDLYPGFLAPDGSLRDELTFDELHLNGAGYRRWRELLLPYLHRRFGPGLWVRIHSDNVRLKPVSARLNAGRVMHAVICPHECGRTWRAVMIPP
jgi:lysophospholipase L1-like esterase